MWQPVAAEVVASDSLQFLLSACGMCSICTVHAIMKNPARFARGASLFFRQPRYLQERPDFDRADSPVVATEFCGTSITSQSWAQARNAALLPDNPHVRFASSERRGYVVMELAPKACQVRLRGIDNEKLRETGIATQASFVVEDGRPGARAE